MSLTLKVLSFKNQPVTNINIVTLNNNGGTIGRSNDNALVLPDTEKFVSRHHASIKAEQGCYYLTDTSLGGIYINGQDTPLHNNTVRLDNNSVLKIGEYEIAVIIEDDFLFTPPSSPVPVTPFLSENESWLESESGSLNSLMSENFVSHEELVQTDNVQEQAFESGLQRNNSPLFDSYIAPNIIPPEPVAAIPDNLSFDDLFADHELESEPLFPQSANHKPIVDNAPAQNASFPAFDVGIPENLSFEDLFADHEVRPEAPVPESVEDKNADESSFLEIVGDDIAHKVETSTVVSNDHQDDTSELESVFTRHKPTITQAETPKPMPVSSGPSSTDLFNAFLQGASVECAEMTPEQQIEAMQRIGKMFRKLIDGTVSVLRSRAEFKSLCRVNMTVIRASHNNPLKFTVSTDDVLQQLIENKKDGFLNSVDAIEESFSDIMNHQLAMQAGIQASLEDLLKTFAPEIIEKQFEQGIVLQKKAKCWDRYEAIYRNTVDDAIENFFGDEFVKAYEKQMSVLSNKPNK